MIRLSIVLLILGFTVSTTNAQVKESQKEKEIKISKPVKPVSFDKTSHNFGEIEQGSPATASFTIRNDGKEPLVITAVSTSCGCTAPAYPKQPVQPGKSGEIKLTYNSKVKGYFKKSAQVKTQDSKFFQLYIEGTVKEGQEGKKAVEK